VVSERASQNDSCGSAWGFENGLEFQVWGTGIAKQRERKPTTNPIFNKTFCAGYRFSCLKSLDFYLRQKHL
jgi:hypothetical protein